jgi:hypothetical protein
MRDRRDRLITNQAATIKAFTTIVAAGRKAKLAPLTWRIDGDSPALLADVDMLVWLPDHSRSDEEATAAARMDAFNGWSALIERLTARSIDQYGHHPAGERMLTRFDRWDPHDTGIGIEYRAFARNISIDVDRRYCAWLISLGVRATVDKRTRRPAYPREANPNLT